MTAPASVPPPTAGGRPVWDLPTRIFHWGLVASVALALFGPEPSVDRHVWAGHAVMALVGFRLVWGMVGSRHSRFADFAFSPSETRAFVRALLAGRPPRHVGHNPAGALFIFAVLAVLVGLAVTGPVALAGIEKQGWLAGLVSYDTGHTLAEVHEALSTVLWALIAGHLAGVAAETALSRQNLVRAMITGRKARGAGEPAAAGSCRPRRVAAGLAMLAGFLAVAGYGAAQAGREAAGGPPSTAGTLYAKECGDCHHAFHPAVLPAATWAAVMDGLGAHFGEDATLPAGTAAALAAYLAENAAEAWDVKAAHRFRTPTPEAPLAITATRSWRRIHDDVDQARFRLKAVGSRTNCGACHRDADRGRFALRNIHVPEE